MPRGLIRYILIMRNESRTGSGQSTTGVDWCNLTVTSELHELVSSARCNERLVQAMDEHALEQLVRAVVTDGMSIEGFRPTGLRPETDELFEWCFARRGEPLSEASARRDVRERIRVYRRIALSGPSAPETLGDVLSLWSEAMHGEVRL